MLIFKLQVLKQLANLNVKLLEQATFCFDVLGGSYALKK
jgi:hypothetical protein